MERFQSTLVFKTAHPALPGTLQLAASSQSAFRTISGSLQGFRREGSLRRTPHVPERSIIIHGMHPAVQIAGIADEGLGLLR